MHGVTTMLVYPFAGASTHNIFRALGGCIIRGTCGATGNWVMWTVPFLGTLVALMFHYMTQSLDGDDTKFAYSSRKQF